jgi:hypothetical protein
MGSNMRNLAAMGSLFLKPALLILLLPELAAYDYEPGLISSKPGLTKALAFGNSVSVRLRRRSRWAIIPRIPSSSSGKYFMNLAQALIDRSLF